MQNSQNSALSFIESSCPERAVSVSKWLYQTRGNMNDLRHFKNPGNGAASLFDGCMRTVMQHCSTLKTETLAGVPWQLGKQIWQRILKA